ncbi:MAG: hypothetical protein OEZ01_08335 [Candidatus Heimdallarchaeota archaeon]|nr:hypothetical protein [Candidatus Heimdallarchaeota archaeon]MDH5646001.1 hypothetical protein [Candidatus Heimdallarchaeota archaeon]
MSINIKDLVEKEIRDDPDLIDVATSIFEFVQYLLDDDDNLTKSGNLTSSAKSSLEERINHLIMPEESQ